jgi:hypothetical protein
LFEYENVCEWHPSNQTLQCSVVTIRCYPWSAGSWQVFHIVGLCVCSHQSNILVLKQHNRRLSTRTVRNRLKSAGLKSRRPTSINTLGMVLGMVLSTTWLKFKDMAISVSCNRRSGEGLETQTYSLCPKEHPANCPLRWRLSNGLGCIAHDCKLDLVTIQGNLTGDQYIRDLLQPVVCPPFRQPPTSYVGCPVVIAAAILDEMLLPTDECLHRRFPSLYTTA